MPAICPNPSSHWKRGPRRSNRCRTACAEAGLRTARRGHRSGPQLGQGVPRRRHGRAATQEQERRPGQQARAATKPECPGRQRRHGGAAPQGRGAGAGERVDAGGGGGRKKRPRRRPAAPVEPGEDAADRPSEDGVFTQLDGMLAWHRAKQPPTATTPGSVLTDMPGSGRRWRRRSPLPRAGTGTAGSRPRSGPASRRR